MDDRFWEKDLNRLRDVISQLEQRRAGIERALQALREASDETGRETESQGPTGRPRKRRMSAEGRKRIAAAARKRWAAYNKSKGAKKAPAKSARKGGLTAAGRKRLAEAMRKRWAERRAAAEKS